MTASRNDADAISKVTFRHRRRKLTDKLAATAISIGGGLVIAAIILIFVFLFLVVLPMFGGASISLLNEYSFQGEKSELLYTSLEESGELGVNVFKNGQIHFFDLETGLTVKKWSAEEAGLSGLRYVKAINGSEEKLAFIDHDNRLLIIAPYYRVSFDSENQRVLSPAIEYPYGEEPFPIFENELLLDLPGNGLEFGNINDFTIGADDESLTLAIHIIDDQASPENNKVTSGRVLLAYFEIEEGDELEDPIEAGIFHLEQKGKPKILMDESSLWMYVVSYGGAVKVWSISDKENPVLVTTSRVIPSEKNITVAKLLLGGSSLIVADDSATVSQWMILRDENNQYNLTQVRTFDSYESIKHLIPEPRRKAILTLDENDQALLLHTTAERETLRSHNLGDGIEYVQMSPRANVIYLIDSKSQVKVYAIHNEHPEISWKALWGRVWYEGYSGPDFIWQSSSADNDFEPKFSLAPLAFGTLKAAFYAMLVAAPIAIMGAIYTAYFMAPAMRTVVKPGIELMEALPTVILGFLAGLWLAPIVEESLFAILLLIVLIPFGFLLFAWFWQLMPSEIRNRISDGWYGLVLMPVLIFLVWFTFLIAPGLEGILFSGNLQDWMLKTFGIGYDQRNSLVVGIAMGLAVIPTIYSITEDAIFSVPKHLSNGSLALGATPWQTLTRVVLLTASPGIFSAVMIGLGRAVGETMIVLMATGNTPVMDFSVFEGMRTLSANIAVELPESELNSTHYRILFLAALVLFGVTFMFNTAAEIVRQRLRVRYGSL